MASPTARASVDPEPELRVIEPLCARFRRTLRTEGLKYTIERARILDAVMRREGLFHADDLIQALREDRASGVRRPVRVSKATVYRTLKLMQQAGVVQRVVFGSDDAARYQVVAGTPAGGGALLVRLDQDSADEIDVPGLKELCERVCAEQGLILDDFRLQVFASPRTVRRG